MELTPAIKGSIGDWEYYLTLMKFSELANRVQFAHEIHPHSDLDTQIQREISKRVNDMKDYLINQNQHFYGSIIVAVYGGQPIFESVKMDEHPLLNFGETPFGLLKFDGTQRYFALDGQHRLASIIAAIKEKPELRDEEISVIMVPHYASDEGIQRTRRLFTALNRYAVKTAQHTNIIIDEDDAVAITTRWLIRDYDLFAEKLLKLKGSSIQINDMNTFLTLPMVYDINQIILKANGHDYSVKSKKQIRPPEDELELCFDIIRKYWMTIVDTFSDIKKVYDGLEVAGVFRSKDNPDKGSLLFRPLGQRIIAKCYSIGLEQRFSSDDIFESLNKVNWKLGERPWQGVIWKGQKMQTQRRELEDLVVKLLCYMVGYEIPKIDDLLEQYRVETEVENLLLPGKVS